MIRAIIIDDEIKSRETLNGMLSRYCKNVEIVAEADGYTTGISQIKKHQPDVIFLDIQMLDGSGFKLLEDVGEINFEVIFTTAFDQYAIRAIKYSALDYLLKPVLPEDLINAVEKVEKKHKNIGKGPNIEFLLENLKNKSNDPKKIILSTSDGMHVIEIDDIIRCESDDYYTIFFLKSGKKIMVSKTLKENEELLSAHNFIRPHKSHLVNVKYIKSFLKVDGGSIVMSDGSEIPVSRRKREAIVDLLNNF